MNLEMPEKSNEKKKLLILYFAIAIVCVVSIFIVVYFQLSGKSEYNDFNFKVEKNKFGTKSSEKIIELEAKFDQIFENKIIENVQNSDEQKENVDLPLVFTNYEKKETKINCYDIEVHIPKINVKSEKVVKYNEEIKKIFETKVEEILKSKDKNIVYNVEYVATIKDGIISLIIQSNLKQGGNVQRKIIQTYNYDLKNDKEITLDEMLKIKNVDKQKAINIIKDTINKKQKEVEALKDLGYNIYERDANSEIYDIDNTSEFYVAEDTIYIIYAYGNGTFTSEMDLVIL